ncbi:transcription factor PAP1-domain-containing protein [Lasiosphaeria ovina]|uniref:Transcription factor PAP1-domain-containing protein n=1 Tax=Lasiosphaeria ovina TaxID=92902 RepID=A0AAE0NN18_9PEZI|nr:transcription factor PAP1-domain-containing protein [Lasiosphaeria ovina]
MTSTRNPLQDFILTPQQQNLLFAALNSNKPGTNLTNAALSLSPPPLDASPDKGPDTVNSFQESPDLDYDYDFGGPDSSFDFSFDHSNNPRMIGDLPGASSSKSDSPETESPDKRSHPDDDDDDEDLPGGAKRRESEDKVAKKPGRKPLTTEPSSKRKAQNRAAQRAFRERKEKHLKDLETKVQELEKVSEATNHENDLLRAKVDKMTVELNEYKKRVSVIANSRPASGPSPLKPWGSTLTNNLNDVNFQFEFPKFGSLPGAPAANGAKKAASASMSTTRSNSGQLSPSEKPNDGISPSNSSSYSQVGLDSQTKEDLANLTANLFTPPLSHGSGASGSTVGSLDSHFNLGGVTSTSSPSASSNSNAGGPSSSCGTSPEPSAQSPTAFKPLDTLSTIGEEQPGSGIPDFSNFDANFSWLPNNFQFDPQLFGGYRESQENVLTTGLDDSFFNEAFEMDFTTPYNLPVPTPVVPPKNDLISQIDAAKNTDESSYTCNKIWETLQKCPKVQNGDFDLDGLCSDLQKKAKCSGSGAVVDEKDFKKVMQKYLGKSDKDMAECDFQLSTATAEA